MRGSFPAPRREADLSLIHILDFQPKDRYSMDDLLEIMRLLRSPEGCPWDREQDHKSIRSNFLEETHEALEAIEREDPELLLQ